jgi:hypothetical protein
MKKDIIFVIELTDGTILAATRDEIDCEIKYCEEGGFELNFKTIGQIKQPPQGLSPDFQTRLIEFFDKDLEVTPELRDSAALAIINHIIR